MEQAMKEHPIDHRYPSNYRTFSVDWFTQYSDEWLKRLSYLKGRPVHVLEIGSFEGQSTCWILENLLTHNDSTITCVDLWDGSDPILKDRTLQAYRKFSINTRSHRKKMVVIKGSSLDVLPKLVESNKQYDVVFVDGNHEGYYVLQDLFNGWDLLKDNGWLILDDYNWENELLVAQPKEAFELFVEISGANMQWEKPVGRQLYVKKNPCQ